MHHFYSGFDPVRALRILVRARRYDVIACVGDTPAFLIAKLRDWLGATWPIVLIDPGLGEGYARRERLQKDLLPRMNAIVVYGTAQLEYLCAQYGTCVPATFIHHRIDTDFYYPRPLAPSSREPVVFSIGNDAARDFRILDDVARLASQGSDAAPKFVVQTTLPIELSPRVTVRRHLVSYVELRDLYAEAAVVALPLRATRHAGGINSLLEAMAMGRPVVVSASPGIRDYVEHETTALVVPCGDAGALASAIRRLLDNPEEAARLGAAARRFVVKTCANPVYARALATMLLDVPRR
jgi:glycosyltransferase involved in cell wall biosynthesis